MCFLIAVDFNNLNCSIHIQTSFVIHFVCHLSIKIIAHPASFLFIKQNLMIGFLMVAPAPIPEAPQPPENAGASQLLHRQTVYYFYYLGL